MSANEDPQTIAVTGVHAIFFLIVAPLLFLTLVWVPLRTAGLGTAADFITFYSAGQMIRDGRGADLYSYEPQLDYQQRFTEHLVPLLFNHPPFEGLIFVPLSYFPFSLAYMIWTFCNLSMMGLVAYLLQKFGAQLGLVDRLTLLGSSLYPTLATILQGQDSILMLLIYTLTFLELKHGREFVAGCLFALGVFKPQLVIPIALIFLIKKRWNFVAGFSLIGAGLIGISGVVVGLTALKVYAGTVLSMNSAETRELFHIHPWMMPNVRGIMQYGLEGRISPTAVNFLIALISVALLGLAARNFKTSDDAGSERFNFEFSFLMITTILVSYHILLHDLTLLVLSMFLILSGLMPTTDKWARVVFRVPSLAFFATVVLMGLFGNRKYSLLVFPLSLFWLLLRGILEKRNVDWVVDAFRHA